MAISDYNNTPSSNADISGTNIAEGCSPAGINNAIRQMMADIKDYYDLANPAGNITVSGAWTYTANQTYNDNVKALFGTGGDLEIYHNGINSIITDVGTGSLLIGGTDLALRNGDLSKTFALCINGAGVTLYHNDSAKMATTSTGVTVTGAVSATTAAGSWFLDEDDMASNSATKIASQQSIKAYVDTEIAAIESPFGAFTSGGTLSGNTSWTMSGIDSAFNHIQIQFDDVSLNGTANILVQFTVGGTPVTSGYLSTGTAVSASSQATVSSTAGFIIISAVATVANTGHIVLSKFSGAGAAVWMGSGNFYPNSTNTTMAAGRAAPGGTIDGIRVTTTNGTDTFDSGRISMRMWK